METFLDVIIYSTPIIFIALSRMYMLKYRKLQGTGKIPDIMSAEKKQTFFFVLSLVTALVIFIFV
nr:hypothetical protein [uncultured Mucilaginibacter sp.]